MELDQPTNFGKTDLVHLISKRLGLKNYLELCTRSTGNYYREISHARFNTSRRLMYNCPHDFDDGLPIDIRIADFDIAAAVSRLKNDTNKIDICLVDGWHTYDCAIRDLSCAFDLLADGGVLVVHDCLPADQSSASPAWISGIWAGVSYRAYLDFVLGRGDLDYCTVNVDHGCGIIFKNRTIAFLNDALPPSASGRQLIAGWHAVHNDDKAAFQFFVQNYAQLLRLISAKTFVHRLRPSLVSRTNGRADVQ